jgi:DNA-binding transcriptional ArsR family regulator
MLLDVDKFPDLLQESYFRFAGQDYLFFPDKKTEFYSLNYYKRKIQSFQEFLYTMEVLYFLNPQIEWEYFLEAAFWVSDRSNGRIIRTYGEARVTEAVSKIWGVNRKPYVNQYRRVVFNPSRRFPKNEKLRIVGRLCGGMRKRTTQQDLYDVIEEYMAEDAHIAIKDLAESMGVTRQTISNHLSADLKDIIKDHNETLK